MAYSKLFTQFLTALIGGLVALTGNKPNQLTALGQSVVPDSTLGASSSTITGGLTIRGLPSTRIDGGLTRGTQLFHSFSTFNVPAGGGVYFAPAGTITNVFARVTGHGPSNVAGTLGVLGNANLFLLNPNGWVFAPTARLDVPGSLIVTSGNYVRFDNNERFGVDSAGVTTPLLTVNTPVGLGFTGNSAVDGQMTINGVRAVRNTFGDLQNQSSGLIGASDRTLAFVGGTLNLDGAVISINGGRLELGAVGNLGSLSNLGGQSQEVALKPVGNRWTLDYQNVAAFRDITLTNETGIDVSGVVNNGEVQVQGRAIRLLEGSEIENNTIGSSQNNNTFVRGTELVEISGLSRNQAFLSALYAVILPGATGNGGNITIETKDFRLSNSANISVTNFIDIGERAGNSGNVTLRADTATIGSAGSIYDTGIFAGISRGGTGRGGSIRVEANQLNIIGNGILSTTTSGVGQAGDITLKVRDQINIVGDGTGSNRNGVFARVLDSSSGNGGNVLINTNNLTMADGMSINLSTNGVGNAGKLTVNAKNVTLSGTGTGLYANVGSSATGKGGNIEVNSQSTNLLNGATITTSDIAGRKGAGNIVVNAGWRLFLDNNATIKAESAAGAEGNINVTSTATILRHNSQITTNATRAATGGNINLDTGSLVLLENSVISANAVRGRGGNILITTQGIFTANNTRITASSELKGQDGLVRIFTPETLVQNSLVTINASLGEAQQTIAGSCLNRQAAGRNHSSFTVTGSGGIPRNPIDESAASRYGIVPATDLQGGQPITTAPAAPSKPPNPVGNKKPNIAPPIPFAPIAVTPPTHQPLIIQEAETLSIGADGRVLLGMFTETAGTTGTLSEPNLAKSSDLICDQ
ncbi:MAG: filamentous hemagglutinin N-terminal domain-containing protein [Pseudanabaenaceae cyanobacterium]